MGDWLKVGGRVHVPAEGRDGDVVAMIGMPPREVWVETDIGACGGWEFVWLGRPGKTNPECLNRYRVEALEPESGPQA